MKQYWQRLNDALAQLEPRERLFVLAGAIAVGLTILYAGVWSPLANAHLHRAAALDSARLIAGKLEQAAAQQARAQRGGAVNRGVSLLSAVDQTSRSPVLGKTPSRVQPEGDTAVNVWIEDVGFDNLVRWLADLEARYGITVQTADVERQAGAGLVNVHITLSRQ